jgi:hypothetical protein
VARLSRNHDRRGVARPAAYHSVSARLQYTPSVLKWFAERVNLGRVRVSGFSNKYLKPETCSLLLLRGLSFSRTAKDRHGASELLTSSPWGYCVFPGCSCIVRVTCEILHILSPSSLIYPDRFDPANAACGLPASHRSNPVEYVFSGGSVESMG